LVYATPEFFKWKKKPFVYGTLSVISFLSLAVILNRAGVLTLPSVITDPSVIRMLFSISACSYLAVFEAWRITSEIAVREQGTQITSQEGAGFGSKGSQYSKQHYLR
jgi:hypothetical protein